MPFIGGAGPYEFLILAVIALLLFGKRLPEVARSLGKGIVEFKKGVQGIEEEVNRSTYASGSSSASSASSSPRPIVKDDADEEITAPKFEPPQAPPE